MWFALGLVSLSVVLAWQIRWRWTRPWRGTPRQSPGGVHHQYELVSVQNSTRGARLGVAVPDFYRFELKRETWVDRFFKWTGLAVEHQFARDGFDRLVYVASNDQQVVDRMAESEALRTAAQRLLVNATACCVVKRVTCANGMLVVHSHRGGLFSDKDDGKRLFRHMDASLPFLEAVAAELRQGKRPATSPRRRDPFLLPGVVLSAVSTSLAINGLFFLLRPVLFDDAFLLEPTRLLQPVLWLGSGIVLVLLLAHLLWLARSARAHLYLLELLLAGTFGAFTTAASELRDANIEWDTSTAQVREVDVVSKRTSRSRKGGTTHYVYVRDWRDPAQTISVKVSGSFYRGIEPGRVLVFHEHPGRLGLGWAVMVGPKKA